MPNNNSLTLSIVIPVYNEESYIDACLDSIARQTIMPDEVILVDNNSTDRTLEIARSYPFVHIVHENHQGVLFARNRGFDAAKGKIIGRIDADTILREDWCARLIKIFADSKVGAVTGPVSFYDMPFSPANYRLDHGFKAFITKYAKKDSFLFGTNMALTHKSWRKVRKICCDNREIHEDLDLAIHLSQNGYVCKYDKNLRAGMSSRRYDDKLANFYSYMSLYNNTYKLHGIKSTVPHVATAGYFLGYIVLYPLRRSYDPTLKTHSIRHLFGKRNTARKNPMS